MANRIKYIDVVRQIKNDIESGKYGPGEMMPTEAEMCGIYSVGRSTLRKALALLNRDGYIRAHQGMGTMVTDNPPKKVPISPMTRMGMAFYPVCMLPGPHEFTSSPVTIDTVQVTKELANEMGLEEGACVYRVRRVRYVNDVSYAYLLSYINPAVAPDFDRQGDGLHVTEILFRRYGLRRTRVLHRLSIAVAGCDESRALNVAKGTPCIRQDRKSYVGEDIYDYSLLLYHPEVINLRLSNNEATEFDDFDQSDVEAALAELGSETAP